MSSISEKLLKHAAAMGSSSEFGDVINRLTSMSDSELHSKDFGIVKVDDQGNIQFYNRYEQELADLTESQVMGKNFFKHVAVCTNNSLFLGAFKKGVESGSLNYAFPYTFTYNMAPTNVKIHMYRDAATSTNWILVKKA